MDIIRESGRSLLGMAHQVSSIEPPLAIGGLYPSWDINRLFIHSFIGRLTTQLYCYLSEHILKVQGSLRVELNAPAVDVNIEL